MRADSIGRRTISIEHTAETTAQSAAHVVTQMYTMQNTPVDCLNS